jgi:hypothetical protein
MDPCLVGTWKTESIIQLDGGYITRGGGGATVTFRADGLQLVDYTGMEPMMGGNEKPIRLTWEGQASAIISAAEGKARVVEGRDTDLTTETITFHGSTEGKRVIKQRGDEYADFLGPAGLGAVKPQNQYTCTGNSLTYESNTDASASRMNDGSSTAGYTVRLRRQ